MTGEFTVLADIARILPAADNPGEVWIGDDTAVVSFPEGHHLLFTADTMVAGVHADLDLTGLDDFGWKAVAASVSDIAAMGGEPRYAVVTVAGPPATDLIRLYEGVSAAAEIHRCPVVGGDLASAPIVVVTVSVIGSCDGSPVLRSGARPGDGIWVSRPLGAAAAGLRSYRRGSVGDSSEFLRRAHARPEADLDAGRAARRAGARAMIDVSDGLAADLGHVADASGVGIRLQSVPVADGATREEALGGGDDYAIVFCAPDDKSVMSEFVGLAEPIRIGTCSESSGELTLDGLSLARSGWEHRW